MYIYIYGIGIRLMQPTFNNNLYFSESLESKEYGTAMFQRNFVDAFPLLYHSQNDCHENAESVK